MLEPSWDVRGDLRWETVYRLLAQRAENAPGDVACAEVDGRSVTNLELHQEAEGIARALIAVGLRAGDHVALWMDNRVDWISATLAAQSIGAVLVPVSTRFKGNEARTVLSSCQPKVVLTTSSFLGVNFAAIASELAEECEQGGRWLTVNILSDPGRAHNVLSWSRFLETGSTVTAGEFRARVDSVRGSDPADVMYTSGTTGFPKGVISSHGQNLRMYLDWATINGVRRGDRYLIVSPFFHGFGYKTGWLTCLIAGATAYIAKTFDVDQVFRTVERERITILPGPPTIYHAMLAYAGRERYDLSSLRLAVTGASTVPAELIRRMHDDLSFTTIHTGYGLTESTGTISLCRQGDPMNVVSRTSGRPIPGTETIVADSSGKPVRNEPGEILTRGYHVMSGYFEAPQATRETVDEDGWLHTGDIGVMDEAGYLQITGRLKDMMIVGGFNAYPAEIENLLLQVPDVDEVAVVGVHDDRLGEVAVAFVVRREGSALCADDLIAWARKNMANYKVPRHVFFVEALPVSGANKVVKAELRHMAENLLGETALRDSRAAFS